MKSKHYSEDIEKSLLGLLINKKDAILKVKGYVLPKDFYFDNNKTIFSAMLEIIDEGNTIDIPNLLNKLKQKNPNANWEEYLSELIDNSGLLSNIDGYVKEIVDKSQLREVEGVVRDLAVEIRNKNLSPEVVFRDVEKKLFNTMRAKKMHEFLPAKEIVEKAIKDIELRAGYEGVSGLASSFPSIDKITSGFQNGDLIIVAARPSMGKTAFALNIAANVAVNHTVALFSLEMSSTSLMKRILSFLGFVDGSRIINPAYLRDNDWQKLSIASAKAKKLKLFIDDSPGIKLSEIIWKARRLAKNNNIKLIVIDYLQLVTVGTSSENRQNEVSLISRTLKQLARELNIPIIALSQLSRRVEQRENKMPLMSDLRESGAIEQDADIIMFLYREAYYDKEKIKLPLQKTDVIFSKHRNGPVGIINLSFTPKTGLFSEIIKEED